MATKNLLRLKRLAFVSLVDRPANPESLAIVKREGAPDEIEATARVIKVDSELGILIGFANVSTVDGAPLVDSQGDATSEAELVKVAAEYAEAGAAVDEMHDEQQVDGARTVFLFPLTQDLAKSLGIGEIKKTGILIGVKVPPDVLAKFKPGANGEAPTYSGFSIGGTGEREPLEKRADAQLAADIASEKARADGQLAKAKEQKAYEDKITAEMHVYLDTCEKDLGLDYAMKIAETNRDSIAKWGATWIEKRNAKQSSENEEPVEKAIESFMKAADANYAKACSDYEAAQNAFAKANPSKPGAFFDTPEARAAYATYEKARTERINGPVARYTKSLDAELETLSAEIAKQIEEYSIRHNLDPSDARKRIEQVSPSFKALVKRQHEATSERAVKAAQARADATNFYSSQAKRAQHAEQERLTKAAEHSRRQQMPPSARKLDDRIAKIATERGITHERATAWALEHDEVAQTLYAVAHEER